jgi:hypothetical protein
LVDPDLPGKANDRKANDKKEKMYEAMVGNSRVADRPLSGAKQQVETSASDPKRSRRASSISAAEIELKQIEWLWPGRIPANAITVLAGDPGLGASHCSRSSWQQG